MTGALVPGARHPLASRSALFVPGDDQRKMERALATPADAVILDLEDAVAAERKGDARAAVRAAVGGRARGAGPAVYVRCNPLDSAEGDADLELLGSLQVDAVVVAKVSLAALERYSLETPVVALVVSARALVDLAAIAAHPAVARLQLGAEDLRLELQLGTLPDVAELDFARSQLVVHSAAAGLEPPIDAVHLSLRDGRGLVRDSRRARALGFSGKACIHPRQVELVNRAFGVQRDELRWARRIVALADDRDEAVVATDDGEMVDAPVVERARRILARAEAEA